MPFCWRVRLYFACGCVQETATAHSCDNNVNLSSGCSNVWTSNRSTRKKCTDHRDSSLEGGYQYTGGGDDQEVEMSVEGPSFETLGL
ncbi:hypothetical protein V8F06_008430 [Rhypophila decipiens]